MNPYVIAAGVFGVLLLVLMWFVTKLGNQTQYIAKRADDPNTSNPLETREKARKALIKKITTIFTVWFVLCLGTFSCIAMGPTIQNVQAALNPTDIPTITNTPTATPTRTISPTPQATNTRRFVLSSPTPTGPTSTPTSTGTPLSTPTPKIVYQQSQVTVVVVRTVIVPVTQIVVKKVTVVYTVIVTPTDTLLSVSETPTVTPTPTETATMTFTFTPTLTPTPSETWTPSPTGVTP